MSTADSKQPTRKQQKQKESKSQQHQNATERLKTVVRRLPPNLPEEIFWHSVQAWVTDDTVTWKLYCPGKIRKRVNKETIPSRAYIAFKNEEMVATFSHEYDGHLFRDKAGNESQAIVEFAPFQKIPTEKKKVDARNNTIDKDEDYLSFLESLKDTGKSEAVSLEALIAASQPPPPPTTTPLLEALKAEKSAQKDKETILRNHAHYKDPAVSGALSKKEEAKKKAATAQAQASAQPAKQPEPPTPTSKKGKKAAALVPQKAFPGGQDAQSPPIKGQPAGTPGPSKPPPPKARPPKEPHGRQYSGKGNASASAVAPAHLKPTPAAVAVAAPSLPVNTESGAPVSPAPSQAQSQSRKARPVIGLGRHFEAALNGAGVAVGPGERKKRDNESGGGGGGAESSGKGRERGGGGGGRHREERPPQAPIVPSILQRPESNAVSASASPAEVVIIQRPQSPRLVEPVGQGQGQGEAQGIPSRGGGPRRGRGRGGRGGNRGG